MNAALVRDLVRMGLAVGAHLEHPVTPELIDGLARDLAAPVIEALGRDGEPTGNSFDARAVCEAVHVTWGQCVRRGTEHRAAGPLPVHGTHDNNGVWRTWIDSGE